MACDIHPSSIYLVDSQYRRIVHIATNQWRWCTWNRSNYDNVIHNKAGDIFQREAKEREWRTRYCLERLSQSVRVFPSTSLSELGSFYKSTTLQRHPTAHTLLTQLQPPTTAKQPATPLISPINLISLPSNESVLIHPPPNRPRSLRSSPQFSAVPTVR